MISCKLAGKRAVYPNRAPEFIVDEPTAIVKEWRSVADQISLLKSRGLGITNEKMFASYLEGPGYYRTMGYYKAIPGLSSPENLKGVFDYTILALHTINEDFVSIMVGALLAIEEYLKGCVSYHLGKNSPEFHRLANNYTSEKAFKEELDTLKKEWSSAYKSGSPVVAHHNSQRGGFEKAPIWVAVQVLRLGTFVHWFNRLKKHHKESSLDHVLNVSEISYLRRDWMLNCLVHVRNQLAHQCISWSYQTFKKNDTEDIMKLLMQPPLKSCFGFEKSTRNVIILCIFLVALVPLEDKREKLFERIARSVSQNWKDPFIQKNILMHGLKSEGLLSEGEYLQSLKDVLLRFQSELKVSAKK